MSSPELSLELPIESEMLPDEAEPALEAEEVKLVAWLGRAQAAAKAARPRARNRGRKVVLEIMDFFRGKRRSLMVQARCALEKAGWRGLCK